MALDPATSANLVVKHQGRVIGTAGGSALPEVGFILHPAIWGQDLAAEAVMAVIPQIFARFPLDALTADVDPRNAASLRLLARLGVTETHRAERTVQLGQECCDSVSLALPRPIALRATP